MDIRKTRSSKSRLIAQEYSPERQTPKKKKRLTKNADIKETDEPVVERFDQFKMVDQEKAEKGKLDYYAKKEQKKIPKKQEESLETFQYETNISSQKETLPVPEYEENVWAWDNNLNDEELMISSSDEMDYNKLEKLNFGRVESSNNGLQSQQKMLQQENLEVTKYPPQIIEGNQKMQEEENKMQDITNKQQEVQDIKKQQEVQPIKKQQQEVQEVQKKQQEVEKKPPNQIQKNLMINILRAKPQNQQDHQQMNQKNLEKGGQNNFFIQTHQPLPQKLRTETIKQEEPKKQVNDAKLSNENKQIQDKSNQINQSQKNQLWTQKYCPQSFSQCSFNDVINQKLLQWLADWGTEQADYVKNQFPSQNKAAKAALLSGPPGIGKTTIARVVANHFKYTVLEWNASDIRSKGAIEENIFHTIGNTTLNQKTQNLNLSNKTLIIMDEVDGMTGSDRGGIKSVVDMIKATQIPIILICNDRYCQKIKPLVQHCYDLQFKKPQPEQILQMLKQICSREEISFDEKTLKKRVDQSQGDVRQLLTMLQVSRIQNRKSDLDFLGDKDFSVQINIFDATKMLLTYDPNRNLQKSQELFFIDQEIIPLLCFENYLQTQQKKDPKVLINDIAKASIAFCEADIMNTKIRTNNQWSLLPQVGFLSSIYPTQQIQGVFNRKIEFTQHLGKLSKLRKNERQLLGLKETMSKITFNCNRQGIKNQYLQPLTSQFQQKVRENDMQSAVALLNNYDLNINDMYDSIPDLLSNFSKRLMFKDIDRETKTKLTKTFNQTQDSSTLGRQKKKRDQIEIQHKIQNENIEEVESIHEDQDEEDQSNETSSVNYEGGKKKKNNKKGRKNQKK